MNAGSADGSSAADEDSMTVAAHSRPGRWRRRIAIIVACVAMLACVAYVTRRTILLGVARIVLNTDGEMAAQEKEDGASIRFAKSSSTWIAPMKNLMNPIWRPIQAGGVNYFEFAGPRSLLQSYSERSNPLSPYYQAWVGGYVTKRKDGTLPSNLPLWASQVAVLDQRSWLSAMGDPAPLAEWRAPENIGNIEVGGRTRELWHGAMLSHSDLSERPDGPLATLIGMPPKSSWPAAVASFHQVMLDGYFVCWSDSTRHIAIVVYGVVASYDGQTASARADLAGAKAEILDLMKSAELVPVH